MIILVCPTISYSLPSAFAYQLKKQRTNGPVNAHLISGPSKSKQVAQRATMLT